MTEEPYGRLPTQVGEWSLPPDAPAGPLPTVVLVHGGFWRAGYDRHLEDALAADLCRRGYLCWSIDYRSSVEPWPATLVDVAAAYDHVFSGRHADRVDRSRVAVVGHSAGGHLSLWLGSRQRLPSDAPGAPGAAHVRPRLVVAQAPVAMLAQAAVDRLGNDAAVALTGGRPDEVPGIYAVADPVALLPTGVPTVLIHGAADDVVPISQSDGYVAAAVAAGDDARLVRLPGDHFEHVDPTSPACDAVRAALRELG